MEREERIVYAGIMLWMIGVALLLCVCPSSALSFNISEKTENNIVLNVTHEGEYYVFLNEELQYSSNSNQLVFSELEPETAYLIRIGDNSSTYSEIIRTGEESYGGISLSIIVLFIIWLVVMVLGILYMPFLIILDVIPLILMMDDTYVGVEYPLLKFLFAMLIPVTILVFGWRVSE